MHERALNKALDEIRDALRSHGIRLIYRERRITVSNNSSELTIPVQFSDNDDPMPPARVLPVDYLVRTPAKVAAHILNILHLNRRVFARSCQLHPIDETVADEFHSRYHFLGHGGGAFHRGLYFKEELLAAASFSRGRRMDRLPAGKRSFELVRFTIKSGYSIPGGLSKLVRTFYDEKQAGDVMTYVDRQLSDGESFVSAGFKKAGVTPPHRFQVHRLTYLREPFDAERFDSRTHFSMNNAGSIKMIFQLTEGELS